MSGLAEFLLERIAEDEAAARACVGITELARHINGAPIPHWVRDGWTIVSDDERRIVRVGHTWAAEATHITRHDPARVLAECEAKRQIVDEHGEGRPWSPAQNPGRCRVCTAISDDGGAARFRAPCPTLRLLALPWAEHPEFREEWRP